MKHTLLLFSLVLLLSSWQQPGNPWTGKWKAYKLEALEKGAVPQDVIGTTFISEIEFFEDMHYVKTTDGISVSGKYEYTSNKLIFYVYDEKKKPVRAFSLRWPRKEKDPYSLTPEIDFQYPELRNVKYKNGSINLGDVDALYKRE